DQERLAPPRGLGAAVPVPEGSITDRVNRCLVVSEALEMELADLSRRVINPSRVEIAGRSPATAEPEPSHIVFALEKLERVLDRSRRTLNSIAEGM
ncbi:MAG TPA: hypothetical protein VJN72_13950, partial [Gaiellales bacterium]|nr:hypothetical protein [Gaiellales bacterium]